MDDPSASPTSVKARNSLLSNSLYPSSSPKPTRRLSSSSSSVYSTCSTSEMSTSRSTGGLFQQTSMALQNFAIESILAASAAPPRLPVAQNKEPLSLPTTTKNFRGFVQKSGPMFWFQDGVEATLMWQDASWTLMWMAIWAVISVYPWMLLLAPSMILSIILVMTHKARYQDSMTHNIARKQVPKSPNSKSKSTVDLYAHNNASPAEVLDYATSLPTATGEGIAQPPLTPNPPHEGTVKYYENLRDIQNMMRMIIDGYDLLAPTVPYLNWSSYTRSLHILQLSLLTTLLMFFVAPYVPYRAVMLFAGEGVFIVNHPWTKPALEGVLKRMETSGQGRKLIRIVKEGGHRVREWIELDGLDDHVWEKGWRNVEVFENERFSKMKKGASSSGVVGGWKWMREWLGQKVQMVGVKIN
uniref:TECPR1-like DysF domain-containing protein n=1 Tax=Melanopsichium pennsylvanicum 4 TaxID=1398559 RepID=A0A077R468_9BASI|nr:conserved hypothetical protein [Melanopsichium pennsylvanicum 4]